MSEGFRDGDLGGYCPECDRVPCRCIPPVGPINAETFPNGVNCGCRCGCSVALTDGNAMRMDDDDVNDVPAYDRDPDAIPVYVLICADCFVSNHLPRCATCRGTGIYDARPCLECGRDPGGAA